MTKAPVGIRGRASPPATYLEFIADARRFVESRGMSWEIAYGEGGAPTEEGDWDLRVVTGSHDRYAARLGSFAVNQQTRSLAVEAGWAPASLPQGEVLGPEIQEFIKALAVKRCRAAMVPRDSRHQARSYKAFFSATARMPWELTSEDVARFQGLQALGRSAADAVLAMVRTINEHLLSEACPLNSSLDESAKFIELQTKLDERDGAEKLPKLDALYELARIVFRETAATHNDAIRFFAIRLMMLTGLRLNEVLMLPADCLRWEDHVDVVTGRPADEIGGVARSLRLRHFALKQQEGRPDLLVEEHQWVPTRFQTAVAEAVQLAVKVTSALRTVLGRQHSGSARMPPESDSRTFRTSAGATVTTAELLFLQTPNRRDVPVPLPPDFPVTVLNQNAMYLAMGIHTAKQSSSFFARYGGEHGHDEMSVRPHSLRHLMNTEMFRLGVPDTAITQQFGRTTVAQSYEYDHRSLAEKLAFVSLPASTHELLLPGSTQELVAKMVVGGLAPSSHIARSFQAIQSSDGDQAAFRYLAVNSDGFHVTPYGFCVNSFSMNPCARHLKCFDGCKHFTASGIPEHRITLETLRAKLVEMRTVASAKPAKTVGRRNQIAHADSLLAGVDAALNASPHAPVFADGIDHSISARDVLS